MRRVVVLLLLCLFSLPNASAAVDSEDGGGELWFSCEDIDDCMLSEYHVGEESIGRQVQSASPVNPERVFIELPMYPEQTEVALLPDTLDELQVDLRYQDDLLGITRPGVKVTIIIADSSTVIEFEGDNNPVDGLSGPHNIQDEPLNLEGDRLLWPGEQIRILLEFEVQRPGNWQLHLRGGSFLLLDIIWSMDMDSMNVDEPSSDAEPRQTEFEANHYGALVSDDRDCWEFNVGEHEIMRITFVWEEVPSEIEQSHGQPDLITPDRRLSPTPGLSTEVVDGTTRMTWQWRSLETGDYTLCIGGKLNAFQPYQWAGLLAYEGIGPLTPSEFENSSFVWEDFGVMGDVDYGRELVPESGLMLLVLSLAVLLGLAIEFRSDSTSNGIRYGLFVPGVLILFAGGVVSPMWMMAGDGYSSDELSLDELIDTRLEQLWHASHPGTPASSRALHVGATFGMLDGEELNLRLVADKAVLLDDGRWQLHIPAIDELDFERIIFSKVAQRSDSTPNDKLLDRHSSSFILVAAISLVLDLTMLEALLVVDELPESNVIHISWKMESTSSIGEIKDPAWATKPSDFPDGRWKLLQENLYPKMISVTILDDDVDDLSIRIQSFGEFDNSLLYATVGVSPVEPLIKSQMMWSILGMALAGGAILLENRRRRIARDLAKKIAAENLWN